MDSYLSTMEPDEYEFSFENIKNLLIEKFNKLIDDHHPLRQYQEDLFQQYYTLVTPKIGLEYFFNRLIKYSECSPSTLLYAYMIIIKFCKKCNFVLTSRNIFK